MKKKSKSLASMPPFDEAALTENDRWLCKHLDEMSRQYPHKSIAVHGGKLVAVGDSYKEVYAAARAQGIKESPLAMQVPTAEDFDVIL